MVMKKGGRFMNNDEKGKELLAIEEVALQDISGVLQAMDTMEEYETFTVTRGGKNSPRSAL